MSFTKSQMATQVETEIMGLSSEFDSGDYTNACDDASRELGWSFPVSTDFQILWMKNRTKYHLLRYLMTQNVAKFRVKGKFLEQKYKNLKDMLDTWQDEFKDILEAHPEQFASVDTHKIFGTKIDAGFSYEEDTGMETTFDGDQLIIFSPTT